MVSENKAYNGYVGLSTDNKPTRSVNNGSMFYEMDTQKKYMFDEEGQEWIEQPAEGGGSTGGGSVTFEATFDGEATVTGSYFSADDSAAIDEAIDDGKVVWLELPDVQSYSAVGCKLLVTGKGTDDGAKRLVVEDTYSNSLIGANYQTPYVYYDDDTDRYYVGIYVD